MKKKRKYIEDDEVINNISNLFGLGHSIGWIRRTHSDAPPLRDQPYGLLIRNVSPDDDDIKYGLRYILSLIEQDKQYPADQGMDQNIVQYSSTTARQIGRTYTLKKIYNKLVSIDSYLSTSSDTKLLNIRKYVSHAIELFELLISNINLFMDIIDDMIILYYKFLKRVYFAIRKYYEKKDKKERVKNVW